MEVGQVQIQKSPPQDGSVTRWRMDTLEGIRHIENSLRGKILDERGQYVNPPAGMSTLRICNELGVQYARMALTGAVSKNTVQGNLTREDIKNIMRYFGETLAEHIGKNYKRYEIAPDLRDSYIQTILTHVELTLSRTMDDLEREHSSSTIKETQSFMGALRPAGQILPNAPI